MRAAAWSIIFAMFSSSASFALTDADCDYTRGLMFSRPGAMHEECTKGNQDEQIQCLHRELKRLTLEMRVMRCEMARMQEPQVRLLQEGTLEAR
jgi:hypothetical protein